MSRLTLNRLSVSDLTVEFHSGGYLLRPLENFSFEAQSGELVLLLGPSGCGKTTLLSCLAGILTPTAGSVHADGTTLTSLTHRQLVDYRRHKVGIVFQNSKLLASLTARENVEAPLRLAGLKARHSRARAEALLTEFGLAERMDHRPGRLSGGQQQRVAIARALAHDPPLVLADEPTASLDYIQVEAVIRALRDLACPGRIVVVSTHDHRLVPLADRVVDLAGDRIDLHSPRGHELKPDEVLFTQGTRGELIYVVDAGEIDLFRLRTDGTDEILHTVRAGEYFGELAPLLGFPRAATAKAKGIATVRAYTVAEFRKVVGPDGLRAALGRQGTPSIPVARPRAGAGAGSPNNP